MSNQEVGVVAVFDSKDFVKGVNDYIQALSSAESATRNAVNNINSFAASLGNVFQSAAQGAAPVIASLNAVAQAAQNAAQATQAAQQRQQQTSAQTGQVAADELSRLRLITEEINDQLALERLIIDSRNASLTALQRQKNATEQLIIAQRQLLRDAAAQQINDFGVTERTLARIRGTTVTPADLGRNTQDDLQSEIRFNQLINQELRARQRELQLTRQLQQGILNAFQQEQAILERSTIALERKARITQAAGLQQSRLNELIAAGQRSFTDEELGIKQRDVLQDQVRLQQILADEVRDQVRLRQLDLTIADATSTALQRQQAIIERTALLLRRQQRDVQITEVGGNAAQLSQVRGLNVQLADLGKKQRDVLQEQLTLQNLLTAEVADRIREEQASLILNDARSSALQRQQAILTQQTIALERQRRLTLAQNLGGPQAVADVQSIRNATVAMRDLNRETQKTTQSLSGLSVAGIAAASTLGNVLAQGIVSATRGFLNLGGRILDTVTFFERLEFSVKFFTARSVEGAGETLSYAETIRRTSRDAEALVFWLQRLAVSSPFTTKDVATLFRTAQAYGLTRQEAEQFTPLLLDFAAAAGLNEEILERLALAIGQVRARGKLTGEEIRQLGNSGLPIRDILVKALGIANSEFDKLVESGALTSDIVIPEIIKSLKTFEGAGQSIAFNTIGGIISAFKELTEIGTATFFRDFLAPLKEGFQEFFAVANQPKVLAFIKILGKELGTGLRNAFGAAQERIQTFIKSWNELDPVIKQQIVVFGAAFVAALTLAGAISLVVAAVTALTNPLVLAAAGFAFFLSEWTSGFAVAQSVAQKFVNFVSSGFEGITSVTSRVFRAMTNVISKEFQRQSQVILSFINAWGRFGRQLADVFVNGFGRSFGVGFSQIVSAVASAFTFWFKPNSPPRVAPNIDQWGLETVELYYASMAAYKPTREAAILQQSIEEMMPDPGAWLPQEALGSSGFFPADFPPKRAVDAAKKKAEDAGKAVGEAAVDGIAFAAGDFQSAGLRASDQFIEGFYSQLPRLTPRITQELQAVLDQIGSGTQLSRAGALAINNFLGGFNNADFGIFNDISSVVDGFFSNLVDTGEVGELDLPRLVFGSKQTIAKAIAEFREFGQITQATLNEVRRAAGGASGFVSDLLAQYQSYSLATDAAKKAQDELNAVTRQYEDTLKPITKELDAINNSLAFADEEERIASLRRLIANEAVSERRKETAQLQIQQILQQRRVRDIENERDARVSVLEEAVRARQEEQTAAQEQLELVQARINVQLEQLGLVGQEYELIRQLNEEAADLRKKQITELELQGELLRLQGEEIADNIKAAKAKYDLSRADSTELEKQQAILALQEVAVSRRNRLLEAAEFGIPESEILKLRDINLTLADIGVKVEETDFSAFGEGLGDFSEDLVDISGTLKEIDDAAKEAGLAWSQFKTDVITYLTEINNNLPEIFKFLPGENGAEPPIVKTLQVIGTALAAFATLMVVTKVAKTLIEVTVGIRALFAVIKGVSTAATSAPFIGWLTTLADKMTWFIGIASRFFPVVAAIAAIGGGYKLLFDAALADANESYEQSIEDFETQKQALGEALSLDTLEIPTEFPADLRANLRTLLDEALVSDTTYLESLYQDIGEAINQGIGQEINNPDNQDLRNAVSQFYTDLYNIFADEGEIQSPSKRSAREVGKPVGQGVIQGIKESVTSPQAASEVAGAINVLLGVVQKEIKNVSDMALETTTLATQIKTAIVGEYIKARTGAVEQTALMSRLVIAESFDLYTRVVARFTLLRTKLVEIQTLIKTQSRNDWLALRVDATMQAETLSSNVQRSMNTLRERLAATVLQITTSTRTAFTNLRIAIEAEFTLLNTNVALLLGVENGLLKIITDILLGDNGLVPKNIGVAFMQGVSQGILSQKENLATALLQAFQYGFDKVATVWEIQSPSKRAAKEFGLPLAQGVAAGILQGGSAIGRAANFAMSGAMLSPLQSSFGARSSMLMPSSSTSISRTTNYNLNVTSSANSQGIISDFAILKAMA